MAFLVIGKIDILCLFGIQDEVTGEKRSNREGFQNMACYQIFHVPNNSRIPLTHLEFQGNDVWS